MDVPMEICPCCQSDSLFQRYIWYDGERMSAGICNTCGHVSVFLNEKQRQMSEDGWEGSSYASAQIRLMKREHDEAEAHAINTVIDYPHKEFDGTFDCKSCKHLGKKGMTTPMGTGIAMYCKLKQQFVVDCRANHILNIDNDCPDHTSRGE